QAVAFGELLDRQTAVRITTLSLVRDDDDNTSRPAYRETPGADSAAYLANQRMMFRACERAGLNTEDGPAMRAAIGQLIGATITSRKQLTPAEMRRVARAADEGYWSNGWDAPARPAARWAA